jgi:regulator of sirC expression with transglutaminase-like and TPR domain
MDRKGRVLGVLTLKSVRTENLGFAEPVNDLKKLLEKPNTVPMERWLTLGVPDPHTWKAVMGARWTQHSGVVKSELPGEGFGGRTHCIWQNDVPEGPYDVVVNVKLDDESGAAGLIFCCDESNRCYGFYPTGGQLRLTRFDGPDVFSWTIFDTVESSAYRPGDWNQLRVRVEAERLTCFVNGMQVITQEDSSFRDGRAGMCKFRSPGAEFKGFRVGADLRDKPVAPEIAERVGKTLDDFLARPQSRGEVLDNLLIERGAGRRLLSDRVRELDAQVAALKKQSSALRKLSTDLAQGAVVKELKSVMAKDDEDVDLLHASLLIAKHDNPEIDVGNYERMMERMAGELRDDAEIKKGGEAAVLRLNHYLFDENGFHGSRFDYDNVANSYLSDVLENREGLPITIAVVYIELARRIGLKDVCGMPMPARFMVGYKARVDDMSWKFNDVFDGGKLLTATQASKAAVGGDTDFDATTLEPATKKQIVVRMVNNLMNAVQGESQRPTRECVPYLGLLIAVEPEDMGNRFRRALVLNDLADWSGAREDLSAILENPPQGFDDEQLRELHAMYEALGTRLERSKRKTD